jgi:RNA polymerase sigma-70 factor, ECF subfamily
MTSADRRRVATELVEQHGAAVYALCRALVRDDLVAEDLSQDAFARALGALDDFRGDASPRTWLLAIARNRCLDHLRARGRALADDPEPDAHPTDTPDVLALLANRDDAALALAALDETSRALVVLHFGHGVGYRELAEAFALREGALRMRISRALTRMRDALTVDEDACYADDLDECEASIAWVAESAPPPPPLFDPLPPHLHARLRALAAAI